jgi:acetyl-CoA carboxylase carboxyl transferase subunit alpha
LWKDSSQGARAAEVMRITAQDLLDLGIADEIIPEPRGGAQKDPDAMIAAVKAKILESLTELAQIPIAQLLEERYHKYREMGVYTER